MSRLGTVLLFCALAGFARAQDAAWVTGLLDLSRPQNVSLVLDASQMTAGSRADFIRTAAVACVQLLRETDLVSVVVYDNAARLLVPAQAPKDKAAIVRAIEATRPQGEAALFAGISRAAEEVRRNKSADRDNRVLVLSGAFGTVGPRTAEEIGILKAALAKEGISLDLPGMGVR